MPGNCPVNTSFSQKFNKKKLLMNPIVFIYLFIGAGEKNDLRYLSKSKQIRILLLCFEKL